MKFRKVYVVDGIPAEEFYEKNATDLDYFRNGEYWLMSSELNFDDHCEELNELKPDLSENKTENLPF